MKLKITKKGMSYNYTMTAKKNEMEITITQNYNFATQRQAELSAKKVFTKLKLGKII